MTSTVAPLRALRRVPGPKLWWADVTSAAALVSLVIVTSLWIANGGVTDRGLGPGPALTSTGRLTGLVASDLLLLQVLAMARIPWVERSFGQDRLARWHRLVGELWDMVWTYPGMLLATAAVGLLSAVVVLSVKAARRRLRYESWHLIHLYAYVGVGLALPHQLWTGTDFISSPAAHPYSLSAAPHPQLLRVTVKDLGDGSRTLADVRPGTRAVIEGPYGRLTAHLQTRSHVTLMASGIGITPLRALLEDLTYAAGGATVLYRARSEADLVFRAELDGLAATRGVRVVYLIGHRLARRNGPASWLPVSSGHRDFNVVAGPVADSTRHHLRRHCQRW